MKLIDDQLIEDTSRSDRWFESIGTPSSDYQLGFTLGSNWAQQQIKPMFLLFAEWLNMFVSENEHGDPIYWNKDRYERKTTEELFGLWLKEQTKK